MLPGPPQRRGHPHSTRHQDSAFRDCNAARTEVEAMVAAGYNGAPSLTQHLNFPQQPWAAGLAAAAGSAPPGAHPGAWSEHLFRMDDPANLNRRMPPGLEASLATAAEWSPASAWEPSAAPSWLILSACSGRSSRQGQGAQAPGAGSALSPLAQRAADAAVRVAAGLLSPGRWKAPQAVGVSSIAALHNSASLPKNFAPYKYTYKAMSPAKAPLSRSISNGSDEYGRPKKSPGRVLPGTSGTLEGSITALADALSSLESAAPSAAAPSDKATRALDFEPLQQGEFLDAQGELVEGHQPESPGSISNGSGERIALCSQGSMAGAELMDEAFLDSLSSPSTSGVLETAEPAEEWLSTSSEWVTSTEGNAMHGTPLAEHGESLRAIPAASQADQQGGSKQAWVGGCEGMCGFHSEAHALLSTLPELPLEEDAAAHSDSQEAESPAAELQYGESPCESPAPAHKTPELSVEDAQEDQLPVWAPKREGHPLNTPFAGSCAESPFEAPSPRDMQLSPAEEQLIPASGLGKAGQPDLEQAPSQPRSPVLAKRAKTEAVLWKPDAMPAKQALQRSRSAGSCATQAAASRPGKRLFGIVAQDQSEWQPLLRESSQVMEMVGMDTEWMLNDLLACADAVYA